MKKMNGMITKTMLAGILAVSSGSIASAEELSAKLGLEAQAAISTDSVNSTLVSNTVVSSEAGQPVADSSETETTTETTVETTAETTVEATVDTTTEATAETTAEATSVEIVTDEDEASSTLVPGNFFYFVKLAFEKIQLALTFDDVKKAQLLAGFAQERIAEANTLIKEGHSDKAEAMLQKALEHQLMAVQLASKAEANVRSEENAETVTTTTTGTTVSSPTAATAGTEASTESQVIAHDDSEEGAESKSSQAKLQVQLSNNIQALLAALSKVENPRAQEALMTNIEKSFGKIEQKLAKGEITTKASLKLKSEQEEAVEVEEQEKEAKVAKEAKTDKEKASKMNGQSQKKVEVNKSLKVEKEGEKVGKQEKKESGEHEDKQDSEANRTESQASIKVQLNEKLNIKVKESGGKDK